MLIQAKPVMTRTSRTWHWYTMFAIPALKPYSSHTNSQEMEYTIFKNALFVTLYNSLPGVVVFCVEIPSTPKMEAIYTSETLIPTHKSTRYYNPEHRHQHR
jgi:hypothetical protein